MKKLYKVNGEEKLVEMFCPKCGENFTTGIMMDGKEDKWAVHPHCSNIDCLYSPKCGWFTFEILSRAQRAIGQEINKAVSILYPERISDTFSSGNACDVLFEKWGWEIDVNRCVWPAWWLDELEKWESQEEKN